MIHAFRLGPISTGDSRAFVYVGVAEGGEPRILEASGDRAGLEALKADAPGQALSCEPSLADAGAALAFASAPLPAPVLRVRGALAYELASGVRHGASKPDAIAAFLDAAGAFWTAHAWEVVGPEDRLHVVLVEGRAEVQGELSVVGGDGMRLPGVILCDEPAALAEVAPLQGEARAEAVARLANLTIELERDPAWAAEAIEEGFTLPRIPTATRSRGGRTGPMVTQDLLVAAALLRAIATYAGLEEEGGVAEAAVEAAGMRVVARVAPSAPAPADASASGLHRVGEGGGAATAHAAASSPSPHPSPPAGAGGEGVTPGRPPMAVAGSPASEPAAGGGAARAADAASSSPEPVLAGGVAGSRAANRAEPVLRGDGAGSRAAETASPSPHPSPAARAGGEGVLPGRPPAAADARARTSAQPSSDGRASGAGGAGASQTSPSPPARAGGEGRGEGAPKAEEGLLARTWRALRGGDKPAGRPRPAATPPARPAKPPAARPAAAPPPEPAAAAAPEDPFAPFARALKLSLPAEAAPPSPADEAAAAELSARVVEAAGAAAASLVSFPAVALQIVERVHDPKADARGVAGFISRDPALAADVVSVANSAAFRGVSEIESVHDAVARLGLQEVGRVASAVAARKLLDAPGAPGEEARRSTDLFVRAVAVATAASAAALRQRGARSDHVWLGGLLHDVGKALALQALARLSAEPGAHLTSVAAAQVVVDRVHVEVGEAAIRRWALPEYLRAICAHHHDAEVPKDQVDLHLVRLASALASLADPPVAARAARELVQSAAALGFGPPAVRALATDLRAAEERARTLVR